MRETSPAQFDPTQFFEGIYLFQRWEIFPGLFAAGNKDVARVMAALQIPASLEGKRVLDIAPWNGFFSFECARRGASEVVSLGPDDPDRTGYNKVRDLLEIRNCRYFQSSVYDLSPSVHGKFDIVLFLGLIYHLRYPLLALDRIYDVATRDLYMDTPIIDNCVYDTTISDDLKNKIESEGSIIHNLPMVYFTKGDETGDPYNWFMPNRQCLYAFVESSGFKIVHADDDGGGWGWLSATKAERQFEIGLEGFNPVISGGGGSQVRSLQIDGAALDVAAAPDE